jgi:hypothetical protein
MYCLVVASRVCYVLTLSIFKHILVVWMHNPCSVVLEEGSDVLELQIRRLLGAKAVCALSRPLIWR